MCKKKVIYIAGPITSVERYWEAFEKAEDELIALGFTPISPTRLPVGLTEDQYARINFATIDISNAVYFLPGWMHSKGARLEYEYCACTNKITFDSLPRLKEALG